MSREYNPNLLETDLKGQTVTNIDVWASGTRLTIKTKEGAYIDFDAQIDITSNGIFVKLEKTVQ